MNTFKRKTLNAAIAAGLGAMAVAGSAGAVQLSQDGTGSALIYPYYTVRTAGNGPYNTYVNVVNTTNQAKVVKVRFLEGKNSREVLDFNLWLSANDVWAGVITPTATGANLASRDQSCVTRAGGVDKSSGGTATTAGAGFNFTNVNYTAASGSVDAANLVGPDGGDTSLDRTREGYIEIIEMGVVSDSALAAAVTHVNGVPLNCAAVPVSDADAAGVASLVPGTAGGRISSGTGGLMGGATLINVNNGADFGYDPVVLEDFATDVPLFRAPGDIEPTLNSANPVSNVFYYHPAGPSFTTDTINSVWVGANAGALAVSAVINRVSVMNNYVLDNATNSSTDWVLTFPTKRQFVVPAASSGSNSGSFTNWSKFAAVAGSGSCGTFSVTPYDREERSPGAIVTDIPEISPQPIVPDSLPDQMCWESTVVNFHPAGTTPAATDTLLGSTNGRGVPVPYEHGWARLSFASGAGGYTPIVDTAGTTYSGLPVVGFMVQDFLNPNVSIGGLPSASSYGGNFNHRYERLITVPVIN